MNAQALQVEPKVYSSLGLAALLEQLQDGRRYTILDLGPAIGINVDFWSRMPCKIFLEDFYRCLQDLTGFPPEDGNYESCYRKVLPFRSNTRFDIILGWDIFNYLSPSELEPLIRFLGRHCNRGTLLFALMSTLQKIPEAPTTFKIVDADHLLYDNRSSVERACPRYQASEINRMMAGFQVSRSFLLRNGIQEYLFMYEGVSKLPFPTQGLPTV